MAPQQQQQTAGATPPARLAPSSSPRYYPPSSCSNSRAQTMCSSSLQLRMWTLSYYLYCTIILLLLLFCSCSLPIMVDANNTATERNNQKLLSDDMMITNSDRQQHRRRRTNSRRNNDNQKADNIRAAGNNNNNPRNDNNGNKRQNNGNNNNGQDNNSNNPNNNENDDPAAGTNPNTMPATITRSTPENNAAQQQLQTFFDNVLKLQHQYGTNVITVQDATEAYPILGQSYIDIVEGDCPFTYLPWRHSDDGNDDRPSQPTTPPLEGGDDDNNHPISMPCYTPIITLHDTISNSWGESMQQRPSSLPEVLLLSGLEDEDDSSPKQDIMDMVGPSSIVETLRLLLECARCEALSPWRKNADDNDGEKKENANNNENNAEDGDDANLAAKNDTINDNHNNEDDASSSSSTNATQCRQNLASQGIDDATRKWLARLVATRRIVAVPIVNVAGFYSRLVQMEKKKKRGQKQEQMRTEDDEQEQNNQESSMGGAACGDFPYPFHWKSSTAAGTAHGETSTTSTNNCMSKFPSRLMNELFRSHAFQLGVAFHNHGGEESWIEVPSWKKGASSDKKAMMDISWAYSQFGGGAATTTNNGGDGGGGDPYSVRISHAEQDNCNGATVEQFAFSAGMVEGGEGAGATNNEGSLWMEQCQCHRDNAGNDDDVCSYPSEQTGLYDGSSLRAFIAKVAAPPSASPMDNGLLGFDPSYLDPSNPHDTLLHNPTPLGTNLRMSLLATELVEPYTAIRSIAGLILKDDDILPLSPRVPGACMRRRAMEIPESSPLLKEMVVEWTVGGALSVDETAIMYGKWDVLDKKIFDCVTQPTKQELDAFFTILRDFEVMEGETAEEMAEDVNFTPVQSGVTRWHATSSSSSKKNMAIPPETTFSVSLDLHHYKVGDVIAIYSLARTDQGWVLFGDASDSRSSSINIPAKSNVVNARTNPQWSHVHNTNSIDGGASLIKGRLDWFSVPVTIEIGPQPGFFEGNEPIETSVRAFDEGYNEPKTESVDVIAYSLFMAVVVIAITLCCVFCREERDGTDIFSIWSEHRRIKREKISMDDFFSNEALELTITNNCIN